MVCVLQLSLAFTQYKWPELLVAALGSYQLYFLSTAHLLARTASYSKYVTFIRKNAAVHRDQTPRMLTKDETVLLAGSTPAEGLRQTFSRQPDFRTPT